jgi:hypothetical protein
MVLSPRWGKNIQQSSTLDLESAAPAFPAMGNQGAPRIPHAFDHEALSQHAKLTTAFTSVILPAGDSDYPATAFGHSVR